MKKSLLLYIALGILVLILVGFGWWYLFLHAPIVFKLAPEDASVSWTFVRTTDTVLLQKAKENLKRDLGLFGNEKYSDYELWVSIAQQYEMLGDGRKAYEALNRAITLERDQGLPWFNLAILLSNMGAEASARLAYAEAVKVEPMNMLFHTARIEFLITHFSSDYVGIEAAFADAERSFGDAPATLQVKALWYAKTGRIPEAITAWEKMRMLVPATSHAPIDKEIARLKTLL
jgi:tetratricopeptide (TPR) repeat protein